MTDEVNFVPSTHQGVVIVKRSTREDCFLSMVPAEVEKATSIVGSALSMSGLPHPEYITNSPFVVRFFAERKMALERSDQKGSLPFRIHEGDELIKVIRLGLGMALNERTQGRALPVRNQFFEGVVQDEPF